MFTFSYEELLLIDKNSLKKNALCTVEGMPNCVQHTVMDMQMSLEDSFERVLRAKGRPAVLLCDRGLMDGAAYMAAEDWEKFLQQRGINSADIRESVSCF